MGVLAFPLFLPLLWRLIVVNASFPTTLEGPFKPVTVPFDNQSYHGNAIDLPDTDPQIQRTVQGFEPEQVSVSLSSDYDSVWISWITGDSQIGDDITPLDPESVYSVVQYGIEGSQMSNEEVGYSLVYNQLYPFEGLQNYTSGIIHHVRLTGLEPSTLYQYQCGDPYISAMSDVFYFRTMPPSSPTNYPHRVAVVGDLGLTYNTSTTFGHLLSNHPDLLVLVGGISYADMYLTNGTGSDCYPCSFDESPIHETYQPRWDYWGRFMQPLVANVPTISRFAFPSEESGSSSSAYYSFNAGGIHFVILNPYTYYDKSSDQYEWLEGDLDNVNRNVTPWLVAVWYPPWYSTFKAQYREAECMRVEMEGLLYEHGVDIVFQWTSITKAIIWKQNVLCNFTHFLVGDMKLQVHAYERSNRVYNYSLDPCGPVYITVGNGGSREDIAVTHADDPDECPEPSTTADLDIGGGFCGFNFTSGPGAGSFCWDRQPEYSAYRESSFGHGILEVKNETHALWSWHRNRDYYETAGDILYIVREPDRCLANQAKLLIYSSLNFIAFSAMKSLESANFLQVLQRLDCSSHIRVERMSAQASNKTVHAISFTPEQHCSSGLEDYMGRKVNERTSMRHRDSKVLVTTNPREDLELSSSGGVPGFSPGFRPVVPPPNGGVCTLGLVFGVVLVLVAVPPAALEIQMIICS
ncbi:hypothetical protein OIU76_028493 [Salix suchowensis]|nr:hypothetical protein OIU76_028493 [Salix suchowensis]